MYLHEAMSMVLVGKVDRKAKLEDLAEEIYLRRIYLCKDGQKAEAWQLRRRAIHNRYCEFFKIESGFISLI